MKKIIYSLFAMLILASCSSDDDNTPLVIANPGPENTLKATIDGTQYIFNSFVVETVTYTEPGNSYVDLHVTAKILGDDSKTIEFDLEKNVAGPESLYYFKYLSGDSEYNNDSGNFNTNLTSSTDNNIAGTFSGSLSNFDNSETLTFTSGSFNINYSE